jgi:hypothetical protein
MTDKEILKGLEFRIKNLKKAIKVNSKCAHKTTLDDFESKLEELESIYNWIKANE